MWDVCELVTLATIMQKDVLDHNFWAKALRMTILASRSMFLRSRNQIMPFVSTNNLYFQDRFEHAMYANTLHCPQLCKKRSLIITLELKHLEWRFWCLDVCSWGQGIRWYHLVCPMILTFQRHDLCKITFSAMSQFPTGNRLQILTQGSLSKSKLKNILSSLDVRHSWTFNVCHHFAKICLWL